MGANIGKKNKSDGILFMFDPANLQCWSGVSTNTFYNGISGRDFTSVGWFTNSGFGVSSALKMGNYSGTAGTYMYYSVEPWVNLTSYTLEIWFKSLAVGGLQNLFCRWSQLNNRGIVTGCTGQTSATPNAFFAAHGNGSGLTYAYIPDIVTPNTWTHIAYTFDTSVIYGNYYKNGVGIGTTGPGHSTTTYIASTASNSQLTIGVRSSSTPSTSFGGEIGLIRMWSKILSASEIKALYDENKSRYGLT